MPQPDLKQQLDAAVHAARTAGAFMQQELLKIHAADIEAKGKNNLVSYVDKTCEKIIVDILSASLPEAGFITEEDTRTDGDKEYRWVIDPLDGTTNYLHKLPVYSVSIALLHHNTPVVGVVYEVPADAMFTAIAGGGAFLNNRPIHVSPVTALQHSLLATGVPYSFYDFIDKFLELFKHLMQQCHGIRRLGSAAIDLCYVACGRFEGFYEFRLNPWDVAAGGLIVMEAGGKMTNFYNDPDFIFQSSLVATNGHIHSELMEAVGKYFEQPA
jgi:myo-inositol-1(or 4)-monophosphatase